MRLLVIAPEVFESTGGIQLWNRVFLKALSELNHEDGMRVEAISLNDSAKPRGQQRFFKDISFRGMARSKFKMVLLSLLRSIKADVVILGHVSLAPLGLLYKIFRPALKYGIIVHGIEAWEALPFAKRVSVCNADFIFSVSRFTAKRLADVNGVTKDKIHILPNCLDPSFADNRGAPTINPSFPKGRILLTVSRLDPSERYKGIAHVIMAMPKILPILPDVYYVIVGKGDDVKWLKSLCRVMGVSNHVIFTGYVSNEELPRYYKACEVFLLPSKKEGFGYVLLEAMWFKKPCIGARAGGIPEVVKDGETGVLVEYGNVEAIGNAIVSLLGDETTRKRMSEEGHKRLVSEFTFDIYKQKLLHLMRNVRG
ncbi:MAG: glycosyltransferase family 4 protein [Candidatus Brocadiales bacterium]